MRKVEGARCPKCNFYPCAEFVMRGEQPQWRCNACGTEGDLLGAVGIRSGAKPAPVKKVHKPFGGRLTFAILSGVMAGCSPQLDLRTALDTCVLKELVEECALLDVPEEEARCKQAVRASAIRPLAGVKEGCREE